MRAWAPGKLVLSGAYVVLDGAPALVVAVDRHVVADGGSPATMVTPELAAALQLRALGAPPWFDASALREGDRKLGLGSSAAILVACLGVLWPREEGETLGDAVLPLALQAHRAAQGGGSGVDVAAACLGGALWCRLDPGGILASEPATLPADLRVEVWACPESASTAELLAAVESLRQRDPAGHRALFERAHRAAHDARAATDANELVAAIGRQHRALAAVGAAAGSPIVTPAMAILDEIARDSGAVFGPSGAGGGDVAVHLGTSGSSAQLRERARALGLSLVPMTLCSPGLRRG